MRTNVALRDKPYPILLTIPYLRHLSKVVFAHTWQTEVCRMYACVGARFIAPARVRRGGPDLSRLRVSGVGDLIYRVHMCGTIRHAGHVRAR